MKLCTNPFAHPLTLICQNCLAAGTFAILWKRANIVLSKQQSGFRLGNLCIYQLLAITPNIFSKFDCYPTLEARSVFLTYLKRLIEFDPIDYYSN